MRHPFLLTFLLFYSSFLLGPASFCSLSYLYLILLCTIPVVQKFSQNCFQHSCRHPRTLDAQADRFLIYFILQIFTSLSGDSFPDIKLLCSIRYTACVFRRGSLCNSPVHG